MENTCLMYALSFSLFCQASEHVTNKSNKSVADEYSDSFNGTNKPQEQHKSLMDEYHDSFKPQLETENKTPNNLAKVVVNKKQPERKFGRGSSGPGAGQIDLNMDLDLRLKMSPYERDLRLDRYKKEAFKLLEQDRELFIKSLDAEQRQRFQDIEEKTEKIQYVCKQEEKNIRYLVMQRRQESNFGIDSREEIIKKISTLNFEVSELQKSRQAIIAKNRMVAGKNMSAKQSAEHTTLQVALEQMITEVNRDIKRLEKELKEYNTAKL